ncbi:MAG: hypothetical protein ACRC56_11950 [Bosea sp. (in: a-proteobacteria)]
MRRGRNDGQLEGDALRLTWDEFDAWPGWLRAEVAHAPFELTLDPSTVRQAKLLTARCDEAGKQELLQHLRKTLRHFVLRQAKHTYGPAHPNALNWSYE